MDNQKRGGDYWSIFMMYNEYEKLGSPRNVKKKKMEGREKNIVILLLMQETSMEVRIQSGTIALESRSVYCGGYSPTQRRKSWLKSC